MSRFLELNDAAKILGVSPEKLTDMRQKGEIHGYRDGTSWKFKPDEVTRVKEEMAGGGASDSSYELALEAPQADEDESSGDLDSVSILVSDEALGKSPPPSSSTIIGKKKAGQAPDESDIKLADDKPGSGLNLLDEAGSSDLRLAGGSGVLGGKEAVLKSPQAGGTGDLSLASETPAALGSDALKMNTIDLGEESALSLGEDSDDLVLGGSGIGSDVSLDPGGSGINIGKPSDSGLSLEEPLELGGSQIDSLELPEDEDMVALEEAEVAFDPDQATMLKQDEEFALSPLADMGGEDSSDSGSQVIALEDSEQFEAGMVDAAGMGAGAAAGGMGAAMGAAMGGAMLNPNMPDNLGAGPMNFGGGMTAGMAPGAMGAAGQQPAYAPGPVEAPYSIFNVLSLLAVFMVMSLTCMLMVDVLRNMWAFDSSATMSSSVMDMIIDSLKM
jgi:excisionase family DNA binding protein